MIENKITKEEFLANRKAAAQVIDVETCKIDWWWANILDPYGVYPDCDRHVDRVTFVRSPETEGWVSEDDLPEDKARALYARIERAKRTPTTAEGVRDVLLEEYARAVASLDEVIEGIVVDGQLQKVPLEMLRDGVRLAFAELCKEGTPQHLRLERQFDAKVSDGRS